jgi:hypothetical protein
MQLARHIAGRLRPPAFLGQTDPVFACNDAAPGQHLCEEIVERMLDFFAHCCVAIVPVGHDVDVDVAVPGVTKAGDRESIFRLQCLREFPEIDQMTARDDHILI